jgi:hypothetical protein
MNTKSFGLFAFGILALVLVMGLGSAAIVFFDNFDDGNLNGWTISPTNGWVINTIGNYAESNSTDSLDGSKNFSRTISTSSFETITVSYDRQLKGDFESTDFFNVFWSVDGSTYTLLESNSTGGDSSFVSKTFNLPTSANDNSNFQLRFECVTNANDEFCGIDNVLIEGTAISAPSSDPTDSEFTSCTSNPGQIEIKKIDFNNNGFSRNEFGNDDEWFLFDEIEVDIEIENDGNEDIDNIELFWGLWDVQVGDWVIDFDDFDEIDLKDGDEETLTIDFKLDDDMDMDFDELSFGNNYRLYVLARGEVDDGSDTETCVFDFQDAEIIEESDFVVIDNIDFPEQVQCGMTVEVTADVWNIGDKDQDEVSVLIRNNELGIAETIDVGDIDAFDNNEIRFTLEIPSDASEKIYPITFEVYDEDNDIYENDYDEDESRFTIPLTVSGGCSESSSQVTVSASTVSGGKAGQELVIRATVTNLGNSQKTYTLNVAGSESWASSFAIDKSLLILDAGESEAVIITLNVNKGVSGSQTFSIDLLSNGELTQQPVSVTIEGSSGFSGITGGVIFGDNWYIWGIGLLNLILIIIIIIVAVRIARRR